LRVSIRQVRVQEKKKEEKKEEEVFFKRRKRQIKKKERQRKAPTLTLFPNKRKKKGVIQLVGFQLKITLQHDFPLNKKGKAFLTSPLWGCKSLQSF